MNTASLLLSFLWGFGASFSYALIFNSDYKGLVWTPFVGALGWGLYTFVSYSAGMQTFAYFAASFAVSALAEFYAVVLKRPATVFLIPGLIPLVPGGGMFQTMRAFVSGDMETASNIGFTTLSAAGAIVFGLAIASSLAHIFFIILRNVKKNKRQQ